MGPVSCVSCVSWMHWMNAAETHETFRQESGMRYQVSSSPDSEHESAFCRSAVPPFVPSRAAIAAPVCEKHLLGKAGPSQWNDDARLRACPASTKDLIDNVLDRCAGVDDDAVLRDVFLRLMPSHDELAFRRHSAAPLVVRSLLKPPMQRGKVDFEDKDGVEQLDEFREIA